MYRCALLTSQKLVLCGLDVLLLSTENDHIVQISSGKVEILNIPVISSWKYAGACVSPKGTFMYLYFQIVR